MDINYINSLLSEGKKVEEIRKNLGISEKRFQKEIKDLGFKFDQKTKQYILKKTPNVLAEEIVKVSDSNNNTLSNTNSNTLSNTDLESLNFIGKNIDYLKEMIVYYKRNKESNTRNIDNGKPKSVRINMALKEYIEKYQQIKTPHTERLTKKMY